jgi:hypothetical protein
MVIHARTHVSALERCTVSKQEPKRSGCADPTRYMKFHIHIGDRRIGPGPALDAGKQGGRPGPPSWQGPLPGMQTPLVFGPV